VAGFESGVELGDGYRSTIEQDFTQTFHYTILTRVCLRIRMRSRPGRPSLPLDTYRPRTFLLAPFRRLSALL
jgi:hypothetical protein